MVTIDVFNIFLTIAEIVAFCVIGAVVIFGLICGIAVLYYFLRCCYEEWQEED